MATGNITRLEGVWPETHERAVRDSAGVTLETKLGNINSNINQLDQEVNGKAQFTSGKYLKTNGAEASDENYCVSDFIDVSEFSKIKFIVASAPSSSNVRLVEYNSSKQYVDNWGYNYNNSQFNRGANTQYVRLSFLATETEPKVYGGSTLVWEKKTRSINEQISDLGNSVSKVNADVANLSITLGVPQLRNGTHGNVGNVNCVTTQVVRTFGSKYIVVKIARPNTSGYHYRMGWLITSSQSDIGSLEPRGQMAGVITFADPASGILTNYLDISAYPNAVGVCFSIQEIDGTGTANPVRVTDFTNYPIEIVGATAFDELVSLAMKNITPVGNPYFGERISLNYFTTTDLYNITGLGWNQSVVFYGDIGVFFNERELTAKVVNVKNQTVLATISMDYGTYHEPHCNTATLGKSFGSENSVMPLIYVSQWKEGYERACFVYDLQLNGSTYSLELVQKINLASVSVLGVGPCDFVVDTDAEKIYAIAYKTLQSENRGTALLLGSFAIPDTSLSEVMITDNEMSEIIETDNIATRQDAFYYGGKLYIISGYGNEVLTALVSVLRLSDGVLVSRIDLGEIGEPEAFGIYDRHIVFTKGSTQIIRINP